MDRMVFNRDRAATTEVLTSSAAIETIPAHDGCSVGGQFSYQSAHAVHFAGGFLIEFYDKAGNLLKTISRKAENRAAA